MASINISESNFRMTSFISILTTSIFHFTFSKLKNFSASFFKNLNVLNSESAWHQNLSLIQSAQNKTSDPKLKNRIRFLAVNYLNKIAPIMPSVARLTSWNFFESSFQVSPYSPYQYHRAFFRYQPTIGSLINNQRFALGNKSPLMLTDTDQFAHFFPLKFIVLNRENRNEWRTLILNAMQKNIEVLFDLTQDFGSKILTEGDIEKEHSFRIQFNQIKNEINEVIDSMKQNKHVKKFLKQKSTVISRVKFECNGEEIGGMKILPLFSKLNPKNVLKIHPTLTHSFVEETGIVLGAIHLRRLVPEAFPLSYDSTKLNKEFSKIHFENQEDFIKAIKFNKIENNSNPHVIVLGVSFLNMLKGLMSKIDAYKWKTLNQDPATREILQTVLFKIIMHLNNAESFIEVDNKFIQAIELAHAELATLLELISPFQPKDFQPIYLKQLEIIPKSLLAHVKAGLSKTAETVFAEVNVAVRTQNSKSVCAWSEGFYFEHALLLGNKQKIETALKDSHLDTIDLYGCTFNPSIESDDKNVPYVQKNLITDIENILKEKPNTQHLTVAIDFTNDYFNSEKSKQLLEHFASHIHSGRLNFVFFGSGQKFDMLGMDHFYGSPFYIINNGAGHWKSFDKLFTEEVHKTDHLSTQWFCLLHEFASKSVDEFRHLFFKNTKNIIQNLPEKLFSKKRKITVSKVDEKTDLTFIDVKIKGIFNKIIGSLLVSYFQFYAVVCKVKASIRGSFGFLHPNVTLIFSSDATTLRLHPGIPQSDNQPIIKFLQHIA